MTDAQMEQALEKLERRLRLTEPDEGTLLLLSDELEDAEGELLLYLNLHELEEALLVKVVELAAVYYQRDAAESGCLSASYTEGEMSQSETYLSQSEYRGAIAEVLHSVAAYRRVQCG